MQASDHFNVKKTEKCTNFPTLRGYPKDYLKNKWTMFKEILSSVRKCFDLPVKCGKMRQKNVSIHGMPIVSRNITKKLTDILHQFSKSA